MASVTSETKPAVRYSVPGKADIGAAKNFGWEEPIPVNDFWDSLEFTLGRNFLRCFTPDELEAMHLDDSKGSMDQTAKYHLLLSHVQTKLAAEEAKAAPQKLWDTNHDLWNRLMMGMAAVYGKDRINNLDEDERIARLLVEHRKDKSNLSHFHSLSGVLRDKGQFKEAEEIEIPVRDWLDGRLGLDSSQALGSRRIIAGCVWNQGRRTEARQLLDEVFRHVEESGKGKYAVYQEEQQECTEILQAKWDQDEAAEKGKA